jgi:hypothetical protein
MKAQNNPTPIPHSPINVAQPPVSIPPGAPQHAIHERFATFRAGQFNSVFLLQNFRSDATVTITPLLILQQGEVALDPVTLQPHTASTVDISAFLRSHNIPDTFGTAVMRYTFSPYDGVSGVVLCADEVHHLYVNSYAQSSEEYWLGTSYDAALWAPDEDTYSGWKFTDGTNTVSPTNSTATWSGTIVTSGTVSVNVAVSGSATVPLSAPLTVNPRPGFAFSAVSPAQVSNNTYNCPKGGIINLPSPPFNGGKLGEFCVNQQLFINPAQISDNGPNKGYWYVSSALNAAQANGGTPTQFVYVIGPDLQNSQSAFSLAQCGNYNAQTNPSGFISWTNLFNNTVRHESGTVQSHYVNYVAAQSIPTNNVGTTVEAITGAPGITSQAFTSSAFSTAGSKATVISNAAEVEPCNSPNVNLNATCTFNGAINFAPFASCK